MDLILGYALLMPATLLSVLPFVQAVEMMQRLTYIIHCTNTFLFNQVKPAFIAL